MPPNFHPATTGDYFLAALDRFMRNSGQGRHLGVTVIRLNSMPKVFTLQQRLREIYSTHRILSSRLRRRLCGWQLGWQLGATLEDPLIMVQERDAVLDTKTIINCLQQPEHDAPLQIHVFQDPAVLITWRHGLLDGIGINLLLEQLATGDIAPAEKPTPLKPASSFMQIWQHAKLGVETLRSITCEGSFSAWPRGLPLDAKPDFRVIELDEADSAKAFARIRGHCGDFFQMPFYAALAVRAVRLLNRTRGIDSKCCHLEVPFQQGKRSPGSIFQNRMGMLLLPVRETEFDDLETGIKEITSVYKESLRNGLPQATDALMQLSMHLPVSCFIPFIRFQNEGEICSLFHSHTGTFLKGISEFAGAPIENVFNVPSVSAPPGIGVFFSDFAGRITATLAWRVGCMNWDEEIAVVDQLKADLIGSP